MLVTHAQPIDYASWGFLRHRFVRALTASMLVVVVAFAAATFVRTTLAALGDQERLDSLGIPLVVLWILIDGALVVAPALLGVFASSAAADWTHRRIVALAASPWLAYASVVMARGALINLALLAVGYFALAFGERLEYAAALRPPADYVAKNGALVFAQFAFFTLGAVVALEAAAWALWQLAVSREGFLASRGWRPPVWRLMSTLGRRLGLPAFLANFGRGGSTLSFLYFIVAFFNTGLIALAAAGLFLGAGLLTVDTMIVERNPTSIGIAVLLCAFLLSVLGFGGLLAWIANRRATKVYQDVREWDARAPVVFLRAFDQDKSKLEAASLDPFVKLAAGVGVSRTMDEVLLEHASPYGPVIAIGDPRDPAPPLGAARVFVPGDDLSWQNVVSNLVAASKAVVMCPSPTEGVRWEMDLIARIGAHGRTIYIANPEMAPEDSVALFGSLNAGAGLNLKRGQRPVAAFHDPARGWRVLSAKRLSVQTVTVALNIALQALFGLGGVPLAKSGKRKTLRADESATVKAAA